MRGGSMAASSAFFVRTGSGISGPSRLSAETEVRHEPPLSVSSVQS